jgi:hypothetical protein
MTTLPYPTIRTVGDLIARLQEFDASLPIHVANSIEGTTDNFGIIALVGHLPPENHAIAIFYDAAVAQ